MDTKGSMKKAYTCLGCFIGISLAIKLILIFKYRNLLSLDSDDLNYIKSAAVLVKRGIFVFHNYNEPTVFVTPLYPLFLASIFKLFGWGLMGLQAARVAQALISCVTIWVVFLLGKRLFNLRTAVAAAFLTSFYLPNIVTTGYMLTETLFTALLCLLIYVSIVFADNPGKLRFVLLGALWAAAVLCRPTIALYPILLFVYILIYHRYKLSRLILYGVMMGLAFILIFMPWWVRNYNDYGQFIPLAASTGNPMLQGTYINYKQTPENIVYYKLGKNALETDKTEVKTAKRRIAEGFREDFWGYLRWYTIGKTLSMWISIFYWKAFFGIPLYKVYIFHIIILIGFIGIAAALLKDFRRYMLPVMVIVYMNIVHCITMAFDRYAFPLLPLLSVFSAYIITDIFLAVYRSLRTLRK